MFLYSRKGGWGQVTLAPAHGRPCHHQEMPWPLVPHWFKTSGYATAVNTFFVFLRGGQVSFVPPSAGTHVPHQKCLGHLYPSSPKILGTQLKSARFHISEGGWGQVPLAPRASMSPPGNALAPCAPLVQTSWQHHCSQHLFCIFERWGDQVPHAPPSAGPCLPPEMPGSLVPL